jgi:Flp pilus assembly protein CpaB
MGPLRSAPALGRRQPTLRDLPALVARAAARRRRLLAAGCAALAVAITLSGLKPSKPATVRVIAATHDLAAGAILTPDDVGWLALPAGAKPTAALVAISDAVGHATSGPIRRGEPITDVRLDGGSAGSAGEPLAPPGDGLVATPVRLADVQAAALLRVGEHVDVLAATPSSGLTSATAPPSVTASVTASVVASDVRVLFTPHPPTGAAAEPYPGANDGALVIFATSAEEARALAQAELTSRLSAVVVR